MCIASLMPITLFSVNNREETLSMYLQQELINVACLLMLLTYILVEVFWVEAKSDFFLPSGVSLMLHTTEFTQLVGLFLTVMTSSGTVHSR